MGSITGKIDEIIEEFGSIENYYIQMDIQKYLKKKEVLGLLKNTLKQEDFIINEDEENLNDFYERI